MREIGKVVSVNARGRIALVELNDDVELDQLLHADLFVPDRRSRVLDSIADKASALTDAQEARRASSQHLTALMASVHDLRNVEELEKRLLEQRGRA